MSNNRPTYEEYYLWRGKWDTDHISYPWEREFLNEQFLKHEKKRIEDVKDWYKNFRKSSPGDEMEEVSLYTVPVDLSASWKSAIADYRGHSYLGLSALYNSPQSLLIGLFPSNLPSKYSLIRITKSKTGIIRNEHMNRLEKVLLIEEYEELLGDKLYVDVDYEKRIVSKLLSENLTSEGQLAESFQGPILGAPYGGTLGGISLSSFNSFDKKSGFTKELIKTIELMVPPEYRTISTPKKVYNGHYFESQNGIRYKLAERPPKTNKILSGTGLNSYSGLFPELEKRSKFSGDYSIFSTIKTEKGTFNAIRMKLLSNFNNTEITLPKNISDLIYEDVALPYLQREIDEDLWIQVANARDIQPTIDPSKEQVLTKAKKSLKKDIDAILADHFPRKAVRDIIMEDLYDPENFTRNAQSIARSKEEKNLTERHLNQARDLFVDNLTGFFEHRKVKNVFSTAKKRTTDRRYELVQTFLISNPNSSLSEIWDHVKNEDVFRDKSDLQGLLDWMKEKGYVIKNQKNEYQWV